MIYLNFLKAAWFEQDTYMIFNDFLVIAAQVLTKPANEKYKLRKVFFIVWI